jgi:hypothetical protein
MMNPKSENVTCIGYCDVIIYYVPLRNAVNGRIMQATQSPPA